MKFGWSILHVVAAENEPKMVILTLDKFYKKNIFKAFGPLYVSCKLS